MPYTNKVTLTFEFEYEEEDEEVGLQAGWVLTDVFDDRGKRIDLSIEAGQEITQQLMYNN